MIEQIKSLLTEYGLALVFLNVFLVQAGAPVPAVPTLVLAGALAVTGGAPLPAIIAVAVGGSLLGDVIWYFAGRFYGFRVLQLLCRISISPDSCVRETENRFHRWGAPSLIAAKFIPGFATVAPPLAGAFRVPVAAFLFYSAISAALWAGVAAGAGTIFHRQIDWLLLKLEEMGGSALIVIIIALAVFIGAKWWERQRFLKALRMARISVGNLAELLQSGEQPVIVDVRSTAARSLDPRHIPGAISVDIEAIDTGLPNVPPDREIILYCA